MHGERDESLIGPHRGVVQSLVARLDSISAGDLSQPRVVVLRAESGLGKSRIVREFYTRLVNRQPQPGFWPPLAGRTHPELRSTPLAERKVIGPLIDGFVWPPNALPSFAWWTFNCERLESGEYANVASAAKEELGVFLPPLAQAWAMRAGLWDKLVVKCNELGTLLRDAAAGEATEAALESIQDVLGVTVPGIGTIAGWMWKAGRAGMHRLDEHYDLSTSVDLGKRAAGIRGDTARVLATSIRSVAHPQVPGIVVVEDAHRLTVDMTDFLTDLARPVEGRPLMLVLTAWPEGELHPVWDGWLRDARRAGHVHIEEVPRLGESELATLITRHAPSVETEDARTLARAMPSPLLLELWITQKSTMRTIERHNGALPVDERILAQIPRTLEDVYRQRWGELTVQVQQALTTAVALARPSDRTPSFLPEIVSRAARFFAEPEEIAKGLALAADPAAWTVIQEQVEVFREAALADQARAALNIDPEDEIELRANAVTELRGWITDRLDHPYRLASSRANLVAAEWLVSLNHGGYDTSADVAAAWLHARHQAANQQLRPAIALLGSALHHADVSRQQLTMRHSLSRWLGEVGRVDEAISQLEAVLPDVTRILGAVHRDTLRTRFYLALWRGKVGCAEDAITQLQALLRDQTRVLGADHPDTLATHTYLADQLGEVGRVEDAISHLQSALREQTRVLGADDQDTLATRFYLASWVGKVGGFEDAITQLQGLLTDQTRILGPDHPDNLVTRYNLAFWLGEVGRMDDAISQLQGLLTDQTRILGADHPQALATRGHLATRLGQVGLANDAIIQFQTLLTDQTRILGAIHPDSLNTRDNLARWLGEVGRVDDAINHLKDVLADRTRTLGSDHRRNLATRYELVRWLDQAGLVEDAESQLDALLTVQTRVLGADHPQTVHTRSLLVGRYGRSTTPLPSRIVAYLTKARRRR